MKPTTKNMCSVIVTYNPDYDFIKRFKGIINQLDHVVIIDNNSIKKKLDSLKLIDKNQDNVYLIQNNKNMGIATALNQGIKYAIKSKCRWVLTFDQDTKPHKNIIKELKNIYNEFSNKELIAVIGSNFKNPNTLSVSRKDDLFNNKSYLEVDTVITSGSLISIPVIQRIGDFRDDFFIDCVDLEFCLRSIICGYKVLISKKVLMTHSIGNISMHKFLTSNFGTTNHSSLRRYYLYRNTIKIFKDYFFKKPFWVSKRLISLIKAMILILIFEDKKLDKTQKIFKGIFDGVFNKMGKYDETEN